MIRIYGLRRVFNRFAWFFIKPWVRYQWVPVADTEHSGESHCCFVLDGSSLIDQLIIRAAVKSRNRHEQNQRRARKRTLVIARGDRSWRKKLQRLVEKAHDQDLVLQPVAVYIGRSPARQRSLIKLYYTESWRLQRYFRKIAAVLVNGRDTLIATAPTITCRGQELTALIDQVGKSLDDLRTATIGPDFSHRRVMIHDLMQRISVRRIILTHAKDKNISRRKAKSEAEKIYRDLLADCTQITIQLMNRLLGWFWNRFYDGLDAKNIEPLRLAAQQYRLVYIPCHRSHIDYLVLSYLLYQHNLAIPYVAAGDNLNLPLVGRVLRGGGAFFIRRRFRGQRFYSELLFEYISESLSRGAALEYFIEGGRSRTGRQLKAKPGMLAMTIRSFLRNQNQPLAFVPVHISYEKIIEAPTYISELRGEKKRQESISGFLRAIVGLRGEFGRVVTSFGRPLPIEELLDRYRADWRERSLGQEERPEWFLNLVNQTARHLNEAINRYVHVNPIQLLALALSAAPNMTMDRDSLCKLMELLANLIRNLADFPDVTVSELSGGEILDRAESLGFIVRREDAMGELVSTSGSKAVLLSYYRNSVLHLIALPALVAGCFQHTRRVDITRVHSAVALAYPFVSSELTISQSVAGAEGLIAKTISSLLASNLLRQQDDYLMKPVVCSIEHAQLAQLANLLVPNLERYFLVVAVLVRAKAGALDTAALANRCQTVAQRMSAASGVDAPEFFDRVLFTNFIAQLCRQDLIDEDESGKLFIRPHLADLDGDARLLLSERIRHGVLHLLAFQDPDESSS